MLLDLAEVSQSEKLPEAYYIVKSAAVLHGCSLTYKHTHTAGVITGGPVVAP